MDGARRRQVRRYQLYWGRSRFWCRGRAMTGRDWPTVMMSVALITGISIAHAVVDLPFMFTTISPALPFIYMVMYLFTMGALFATTVRDPGVIPRAPARIPPPEAEREKQEALMQSNQYPFGTGPLPPLTSYAVEVNGVVIRNKYCETCRIVRPPRASHCSQCNVCVERFDHHCPWVGNCVGRRNHRYFTLFVTGCTLMAAWVETFVWIHLVDLMNQSSADNNTARFTDALRGSPLSFVEAVIVFLLGWSVGGLALMHIGFAFNNETTNQRIKNDRTGDHTNPYSRGKLHNFWRFFFGPQPPSYIDRRGFVDPDDDDLDFDGHDNDHNDDDDDDGEGGNAGRAPPADTDAVAPPV